MSRPLTHLLTSIKDNLLHICVVPILQFGKLFSSRVLHSTIWCSRLHHVGSLRDDTATEQVNSCSVEGLALEAVGNGTERSGGVEQRPSIPGPEKVAPTARRQAVLSTEPLEPGPTTQSVGRSAGSTHRLTGLSHHPNTSDNVASSVGSRRFNSAGAAFAAQRSAHSGGAV
jgi:hypothetical protein